MSDNLIVFGANNRECGHYLSLDSDLSPNSDRYSSYNNIVFASSDSIIQGFSGADILFLKGWWSRRSSREILEVLEIYIFIYGAIILGDKKYLPPYLIDKYINKCDSNKCDSNEYNLYSANRFEILDLRGF